MSPSSRFAANPRLWTGGLLACLMALVAGGCGPDYKSRGVVKGKVSMGKKPLPSGTVMFYGKDGITATAHINPDGTYELADAPLGECKVTVTVQRLPPDPTVAGRLKGKGMKMPEGPRDPNKESPELPSAPQVPKEVRPIDTKYSSTETSGLSFTVKKGEQTYDIDL